VAEEERVGGVDSIKQMLCVCTNFLSNFQVQWKQIFLFLILDVVFSPSYRTSLLTFYLYCKGPLQLYLQIIFKNKLLEIE
jgi:hypothetical protein